MATLEWRSMKITNRLGLPQAIVDAVKADPYSKGGSDFSCTELLGPPRKAALAEKHKDSLEEDAADRLWSLYGQIAHLILERANRTALAEKRMSAKFGDFTVSAQFDTLDIENGVLSDYKFQSSWKFKKQDVDPDWEAQLNIQLEILRRNGMDAKELQIIGLLRDWSKGQADRDPDYPQRGVSVVSIPVWTRERTEKFILDRITLHRQARVDLPLCTAPERWESATVYAVMKAGRKSAVRLLDSNSEANALAAEVGGHVVFRPGESKRCRDYCNVNKFCTQYQLSIEKEKRDAI